MASPSTPVGFDAKCGLCRKSKECFQVDPAKCQKCAFCEDCLKTYYEQNVIQKKRSFIGVNCPNVRCYGIFKNQYAVPRFANDKAQAYINDVLLKTIPKDPTRPDLTLDDFNYKFNDKGVLVNKDTGDRFHFISQAHYDMLGDLIIPYVKDRMMKEFGLEKVILPLKGTIPDKEYDELPKHAHNDIYMSKDVSTNQDKLLLLVQGSGAVRPGQWARAVCINDSIEMGCIFDYLRQAKKDGYAVIVFNPNQTRVPETLPKPPTYEDMFKFQRSIPGMRKMMAPQTPQIPIPGNSTGAEHLTYVYDNFVKSAPAKHLAIVAHSAGGANTMGLLRKRYRDVLPRLRCIAFTDSVHSVYRNDEDEIQQFVRANAINWVQSDKPLQAPERESYGSGCTCVSAGHPKHEYTSPVAFPEVFKFMNSKIPQ